MPEKNLESLEKWRISKDWSQSDLAEKAELSQKTVSRLENGAAPSEEVEKKLRRIGYRGPFGKSAGLVGALDEIEEAARLLESRGYKPPDQGAAHDMRRLIAQMLENSKGSAESLADRVERVIRMAEAIRK